ncbi:MAG TPA: peptidoglycan-binding protein [Clostridia bacterium]|nr:peptidoglycan-binding protein [Clostridia bacterium]
MRKKKVLSNFAVGLVMMLVVGFILSSAIPAQAASYSLLKVGSRGQAVSRLQQELKNKGYFTYSKITQYYGSITRDAVIRFQRDYGLSVDGIAGNQTQSALYKNSSSGSTGSGTYSLLRFGMSNQGVKDLQNSLKAKGYFRGTATGYFGNVTKNAVIAFQRDSRLQVDGIVGSQTQSALKNSQPSTDANRDTATSKQRDDIFWLARIVHAESQGEPYEGMVAAGSVVMNRVKSNEFPNSIYGVIFEYYKNIPQFSPVEDGSIYCNPGSASLKAAEEAYWGSQPVGNALYFFNPQKAAGSWIVNNRQYITRIGSHAFYK